MQPTSFFNFYCCCVPTIQIGPVSNIIEFIELGKYRVYWGTSGSLTDREQFTGYIKAETSHTDRVCNRETYFPPLPLIYLTNLFSYLNSGP